MKLLVTAHITALPNHVNDLKEALDELVAATRQEKGCLNYTLYQDTSITERFMVYEQWESLEYLQQHQQTTHFKAFGAKAQPWLGAAVVVETFPYPIEK